jgi:glutamate/aspartate transport system substrate-binding protein
VPNTSGAYQTEKHDPGSSFERLANGRRFSLWASGCHPSRSPSTLQAAGDVRGFEIHGDDHRNRIVLIGNPVTNAAALHRLATSVSPPITVTEVASLDAAYDMLAAGKADAFASDDILLSGFVATRPDGKRFGIAGDYLSYEPYAIGFRRDDPVLATVVRDSFARMASEGILNRLYTQWLVDRLPNGETLNVTISPALAEMYRVLGQPD